MADGVARRLVAGHDEQDEEGPELARGQAFAVDLGVHEHRRDVVARVVEAVLAERLGVGEHGEHVADQPLERVGLAADLRVARTEDHVRPREHLGVVALRDAHHLADDLEGERRGHRGHEVTRAIREAIDHAIDDRAGLLVDVALDAGHLLGREPLRHDRAQPEVLRVVHVDDRAHELGDLGRIVRDVRTVARLEQRRVAARRPDIVVARQRPVARPERHPGDLPLGEEAHLVVGAQAGEHRLPMFTVPGPELGIGQVDRVERQVVAAHGSDRRAARTR